MISKTITLRPNGSMTLPKKMRDKHKTLHYIAMEVPEGVLLKPIGDIEYYEHKDGSFGVRFPKDMDPDQLLEMIKKVNAKLDAEERRAKRSKKRRNG